MAGGALHFRMPKIWAFVFAAVSPNGCSAKDVILEMLCRHGVEGIFAKIVEYYALVSTL